MSNINVIGGEIPIGTWTTTMASSPKDIFLVMIINIDGQLGKIDLSTLQLAEIIDKEKLKSLAASAGWGIAAGVAAGLLTGGLGFLVGGVAGAMAKGNRTEVTFSCTLGDGRRFIATTDLKTWKQIIAMSMTPLDKRPKPPDVKKLTAIKPL